MNHRMLLFFCLLLMSCQQVSEVEITKVDTEKFQMIIDSMYQSNPASVGIMVHIESPENGISWSGSAGYSDKENKTVLEADQPALIASSIKTYIGATVLRLQEEGKLSVEDKISQYLPEETVALFQADGYDFEQIKIKHLLSHTSGIEDYANEDYMDWIDKNRQYRWTRTEQLKRTVEVGSPLGEPQELFNYADANYLLATEIIETITGKPFYTAIRQLLKYEELGLTNTWFPTLEDKPKQTKTLVHQYWSEKGWDAYDIDISFDLYGGGGIATTTKELAGFSYNLFNRKIIEEEAVLKLLSTKMETSDGKNVNYGLGLAMGETKDFQRYGHGGFWGSQVLYFPKLNTSIAVFVLERDVKNEVIKNTIHGLVTELSNEFYLEDRVITEDYELYKAKDTKATLVLYPGGGTTAKETKIDFDIINIANANHISVLMMNFNRHLWIDEATTETVAETLIEALKVNHLDSENVVIGGMSIGGNVALTLSNYLLQKQSDIFPKGVFMIDSPIDLFALYQSAIKDVANPNFDEARLAEPKWIINYFEEEFGKDSLLSNIQKVSPFTYRNSYTSVPNLKDSSLRFYTEPDAVWWKENRQTDFENTNAHVIQQITNQLKEQNWQRFELIETEGKGYRTNGERHPHSWSIVDKRELVKWIIGL